MPYDEQTGEWLGPGEDPRGTASERSVQGRHASGLRKIPVVAWIGVGVVAIAVVVSVVLVASDTSGPSNQPMASHTFGLGDLVAACVSDARTVGVAVAALQAENPTRWQGYTSANWQTELLGNSSATNVGGPFLRTWPTANAAYYTITIAGGTPTITTGDDSTTSPGDVVVHATQNSGLTFDATGNLAACLRLVPGT